MLIKIKRAVNKIIELRKSVDWSQSELARRASITCASLNRIEKGYCLPSLRTFLKICKVFNISLNNLMGEEELIVVSEEKNLFLKFGEIKNLSLPDQDLILSLIKRLNIEIK